MTTTISYDMLAELDQERLVQVSRFGHQPDTSRGLAEIYEDRPIAKCLGIFTVVFAERFCKETPGYVWRVV